jgi:hypothetical protein
MDDCCPLVSNSVDGKLAVMLLFASEKNDMILRIIDWVVLNPQLPFIYRRRMPLEVTGFSGLAADYNEDYSPFSRPSLVRERLNASLP